MRLIDNGNIKKSIKKYSWILITSILLFFSCSEDPQVVQPEISPIEYSFFVAGHTYGKPGVDNVGLHPPFREKFEFIKEDENIQFGVLTGDIVIDGTTRNWDEVDADIDSIGKNVYFAVGNHDMKDRQLFESRYGNTYSSFFCNSDLFIILDPNLDNWNISGSQLDFLKDVLTQNEAGIDNIFVFFHQVLWWSPDNIYKNVSLNSKEGRAAEINFWTEVEPLFESISHKVVMFAGDVGAFYTRDEFMYHSFNNITLIASGMGGEVRDNFVIVNVHEDKTVSYRLIALNGDDMNALGKLEDYQLD